MAHDWSESARHCATILENIDPETANPAKGGAAYRQSRGKLIDLVVISLPELRPSVKRKPCFR